MTSIAIYNRMVKVIESCVRLEQLSVAEKMMYVGYKNFFSIPADKVLWDDLNDRVDEKREKIHHILSMENRLYSSAEN